MEEIVFIIFFKLLCFPYGSHVWVLNGERSSTDKHEISIMSYYWCCFDHSGLVDSRRFGLLSRVWWSFDQKNKKKKKEGQLTARLDSYLRLYWSARVCTMRHNSSHNKLSYKLKEPPDKWTNASYCLIQELDVTLFLQKKKEHWCNFAASYSCVIKDDSNSLASDLVSCDMNKQQKNVNTADSNYC